ncbi:MAG: glycosyltransferase family 1 protein, partial [Pirellulales bacterium]
MKILMCHNYYQRPGGEDCVFADESNLLESNGHDVIRYTQHNSKIEHMSRWSAARQAIWSRESYEEISQLIAATQPAVIHFANTFPLISPAAYHAAQRAGVAVVQTLHNYRLACVNAFFLRDGRPCEKCVGKYISWPGVLYGCYRDSRAASAVVAAMQFVHRVKGTWTKSVDRYIALTEFARSKFVEAGLPA